MLPCALLAGAAECQSVKTAAVETEVWAGFEVLHTANIGATVSLFAELTAAIQVRDCHGVGEPESTHAWYGMQSGKQLPRKAASKSFQKLPRKAGS
jgi:ERCC4-type nuclease